MTETTQDFDLRAVVSRLLNRKWTILAACVIVGAISTTNALLTTPIYRSVAQVAVEPPNIAALTQQSNFQAFSDQEIETQRLLVTGEQVAQRVADRLALPGGPTAARAGVSVALLEDTRVLFISASNADPEMAADIAQGFAEEYLAFREEDALERLISASASLEQRLSSTRERLEEVDAELEGEGDAQTIESLSQQRDRLLDQMAAIQTSLGFADAGTSLISGGGVVLANAAVPSQPIQPQPMRSGIIGTMLGLLIGVGVAFAQEYFDDRLRDERALKNAAPDLSVLTRIPWHEHSAEGRLVTIEDPLAAATECYRSLRTQLRFVSSAASRLVLAFTSSVEAEGKTTVACNYAVTTAQAGYRTLLIDADLRQPRVHEFFGLPNNAGLSHVLTAQATPAGVTHHGPMGVSIITSGPMPPNPSELLGSQQFVDLLDGQSDVYDVVVIDTAPVLPVADGIEVATVADATVVVVNAQHSRRRALGHCLESLRQVDARIAGLVHTQLDPRDSIYDSYYYRAPTSDGMDAPTPTPSAHADPVEQSLWGSSSGR